MVPMSATGAMPQPMSLVKHGVASSGARKGEKVRRVPQYITAQHARRHPHIAVRLLVLAAAKHSSLVLVPSKQQKISAGPAAPKRPKSNNLQRCVVGSQVR